MDRSGVCSQSNIKQFQKGLEETNLRSLASTNLPKLDIGTLHSTWLCMNIATKWHTTDTDGSEANSANKLSTVRDITPGSCSVPILTGSWICLAASLWNCLPCLTLFYHDFKIPFIFGVHGPVSTIGSLPVALLDGRMPPRKNNRESKLASKDHGESFSSTSGAIGKNATIETSAKL